MDEIKKKILLEGTIMSGENIMKMLMMAKRIFRLYFSLIFYNSTLSNSVNKFCSNFLWNTEILSLQIRNKKKNGGHINIMNSNSSKKWANMHFSSLKDNNS